MQGTLMVVGQLINDGMIQEALNKGATALVGGLVVWVIQREYYRRVKQGDRQEKMYKTLFGVDDVDTMEGVVEIIDAHEEDIEELYEQVEKGKEKRKNIEQKIQTIQKKISDRQG